MTRPAAWLLGALAVGLGAGCGGSDHPSHRSPAAPARATTTASTAAPASPGAGVGEYESAYIAALDPVLAVRARVRRALAPGTTPERAGPALGELRAAVRRALATLGAARPPANLRSVHVGRLRALRRVLSAADAALSAGSGDAALARVRRALAALG